MDKVFEQMVAWVDRSGQTRNPISQADYELWKQDFTWEALHGQRYGQSFCNRFGVNDNHLYYNTGGIKWADDYIQKTYIART